MRRISLIGLAFCALLPLPALAGGTNVADYPLRVHLVQINNHAHYRYRMIDYVDGEGRADLYENGQPRGFDYAFRCDERMMPSAAFETYPARWKKPNRELEILEPMMGKPGAWRACVLKVDMKEMVYVRRNGQVDEEPAATYKQWMDRHQFDPEHGKNTPVPAAPAIPAAGMADPQ